MVQKFRLSAILAVISSSIILSNCQLHGESLKFRLAARNLPNMDTGGMSDPYVKAFSKDAVTRSYHKFGETGIIYANRNPVWVDTFEFQYIKGTSQRWKFLVKDWDLGWNADDHLGRVEIDVEAMVKEMTVNGTKSSQPIELFLTQPKGGILVYKPVLD